MAPSSIKVLVCSGNLGNAQPDPGSFNACIPNDGSCCEVLESPKYPLPQNVSFPPPTAHSTEDKFDLIVIGLQEATFDPMKTGKESDKKIPHAQAEINREGVDGAPDFSTSVGISESFHLAAAKAVPKSPVGKLFRTLPALTISRNHSSSQTKSRKNELIPDGTKILHSLFRQRLPSYQQQISFQRGEMRLLVYSRLGGNIQSLEVEDVNAKNTGKGGLANKGGIYALLKINKVTRLGFITCHLEAHEGLDRYKRRCESLIEIMAARDGPFPWISSSPCFVLGDLNFRTRHQGNIYCKDQRKDVVKLVSDKDWGALNKADELRLALDQHKCLAGFETLDCHFPPSFKVERGPGNVYVENRTPSYTDRILWSNGPQLPSIIPLSYEPIDEFISSDHKPIRGAFEIPLSEPLTLPPRRYRPLSSLLKKIPGTHHSGKEKLHLYLSDIQCDIFPNKRDETPPDTHVALFSSPRDLLHCAPPKWYHCYRNTYFSQWPQTSIVEKSFNPDWGDHEIYGKLQAHDDHGSPIQLGGSCLTIKAVRCKNGQKGDNVGSFVVNLEYLYRACIGKSEEKQRARDLLAGKGNIADGYITLHDSANENMLSLDINGPMSKDGQQTGVIRCSLDAWWISDGLAHAAKSHSLENGLSSDDTYVVKAKQRSCR